MKIGSLSFDKPLFLAPMAGVTDQPFRVLCHEMGASVVCMEMVSANAIKYGNKKTEAFVDISPLEHPVSMQLFGPDPETIALAAKYLDKKPFDILDINMGCPMPKIVKNGEGSALMRNPDLAAAIVKAAVEATDRPVTVKIRAGFNDEEKNAPDLARRLEDAGATMIVVHGRTREQYYSGEADWNIIKEVKKSVSIPVIGNGDIRSYDEAMRRMDETGVDGVMIGRGAQGNPWIFCGHKPDVAEVKAMMKRHARLQIEAKGDHFGVLQMRKHVAWYTGGMRGGAVLRQAINQAKSLDEIEELIDQIEE
ncbi:MAG: tRNA dihydrouridine synthase DusB [Lachnospiraceae bacterium]|nr:tRNA dihydrouridine synthase DusB [Candidatus Equihabitans merdae]